MVIDYFATEVVLVKINGKVDTVLAKDYSISAYPTLVLTNSEGEEIDRIVGYYDAPEFVQKIKDYRNGIGTLADLLSKVETSSDRLLFYEIAEKVAIPRETIDQYNRFVVEYNAFTQEFRDSISELKKIAKTEIEPPSIKSAKELSVV